MHGRRESVRACDEIRSAIGSVDHAPTEMVLARQCADVSKLTCHMRVNGDLLDQDLLVAFDGQLRASVSAPLDGDLPVHSWWLAPLQASAADWASARRWGLRSPTSSPVASCAAPWCPPWSITSALPSVSRISSSWQSTTRVLMQPSRASFRRFRPTQLSFFWDSLTTPWLSVSFPGATSSLGSETPCRTSPSPPPSALRPSARSGDHSC